MRHLIGVLFTLAALGAEACVLKPQEILGSLKSEAPKNVVARLWDGGPCEAALFRGLSSGKREWIEVAVALRPHTDAWTSESLQDSLGEAMQIAPSRVLPLVGSDAGFDERICLPWMMDDSGKSDDKYRRVIRNARTMFSVFAGLKLSEQAKVCLNQVAIAEAGPLFMVKHEP